MVAAQRWLVGSGRMAALVGVLVATLLVVAPPAGAGTPADPEVVDRCGELALEGSRHEAHPPWQDICSAWFETLTAPGGPPALAVRVEVAGDLSPRTPTEYEVRWRVGDCGYMLGYGESPREATGVGTYRHHLHVSCGPMIYQPCYGGVASCGEWESYEIFAVPRSRFREDGSVLSLVLVFEGGLAKRADDFAAGRVLEDLTVEVWPAYEGAPYGTFACAAGNCVGSSDVAGPGRPFTMAPPHPDHTTLPRCTGRPAAQASASSPHMGDPADDHTTAGPLDPSAGALDLRALWVGVLPGSPEEAPVYTVNLLPAGPGPADEDLTYLIDYGDGRFLRADGQVGGGFSFEYGTVGTGWLGGVEHRVQGTTPGTVDPLTGRLQMVLPESQVPDRKGERGRLELHGATTWYTPPVEVRDGDGVPMYAVYPRHEADRTEPAVACTVTLW